MVDTKLLRATLTTTVQLSVSMCKPITETMQRTQRLSDNWSVNTREIISKHQQTTQWWIERGGRWAAVTSRHLLQTNMSTSMWIVDLHRSQSQSCQYTAMAAEREMFSGRTENCDRNVSGVRFTKYLTIYHKITLRLSQDELTTVTYNMLRVLLWISLANLRTLPLMILQFCKRIVHKKSLASSITSFVN